MLELTVYVIMAILALSLALIWGFGGILCFGQSAFFGLGAYTYAIAMFNIGESTVPLLLAIILPAAFAALLGYFMFYGRISDVYLGVITLTVTLILFNRSIRPPAPNSISAWRGSAASTAFPAFPPLKSRASRPRPIDLEGMFYLSTAALLADLFRPAAAAGEPVRPHHRRHSRERARAPNCWATTPAPTSSRPSSSAAALAGLAGCLFANWGNFVSPTIFGLAQSAQIIIWVIVGGRGTLIGPIVGCIGIQWLTAALGANQPSGSIGGRRYWPMCRSSSALSWSPSCCWCPKGLVPTLGDFGHWLLRFAHAPKRDSA